MNTKFIIYFLCLFTALSQTWTQVRASESKVKKNKLKIAINPIGPTEEMMTSVQQKVFENPAVRERFDGKKYRVLQTSINDVDKTSVTTVHQDGNPQFDFGIGVYNYTDNEFVQI